MTAVFLLSDEAPYIVATTIKIDGGRMALFMSRCIAVSVRENS